MQRCQSYTWALMSLTLSFLCILFKKSMHAYLFILITIFQENLQGYCYTQTAEAIPEDLNIIFNLSKQNSIGNWWSKIESQYHLCFLLCA